MKTINVPGVPPYFVDAPSGLRDGPHADIRGALAARAGIKQLKMDAWSGLVLVDSTGAECRDDGTKDVPDEPPVVHMEEMNIAPPPPELYHIGASDTICRAAFDYDTAMKMLRSFTKFDRDMDRFRRPDDPCITYCLFDSKGNRVQGT